MSETPRDSGTHQRSRSLFPGTPEYERMVEAGEHEALDREMDSGWRYAEEDAFARLRRLVAELPGTMRDDTPLRSGITIANARHLLSGYDRLVRSERAFVEFRNADLARRMAESAALRTTHTCPTCTKPTYPPAVQALIDAAQVCLNEERKMSADLAAALVVGEGVDITPYEPPRYTALAAALDGVK